MARHYSFMYSRKVDGFRHSTSISHSSAIMVTRQIDAHQRGQDALTAASCSKAVAHMRLPINNREAGNGRRKLELHICTSQTPFYTLDAGQRKFWGILRALVEAPGECHTYMSISGFQVDATAKATVQFGFELAHFLTQFAEFLLEAGDFVVDFVHGSRQAFLYIRER